MNRVPSFRLALFGKGGKAKGNASGNGKHADQRSKIYWQKTPQKSRKKWKKK
jgi:hypothetical protein